VRDVSTTLFAPSFPANTFEDCGGYVIELNSTNQPFVCNNSVRMGVATTNGRAFSMTSASEAVVNSNSIQMVGADRTFIDFGAAGTPGAMCSGNRIDTATGTLVLATAINVASGVVWGVSGAARTDLNYVS
jgi:hypothetical protein